MEEGKDLIRYFSMPCKATKTNGGRTRNLPRHAPEKWATYKAYNAQDVETERAVYKALLHHALPEHEWALYALDQRINDRGVRVDRLLVKNAMAVDLAFSQQAFQRARELTGLENPGSVSQLKAWLYGYAHGEPVQAHRAGEGRRGGGDRERAAGAAIGTVQDQREEVRIHGAVHLQGRAGAWPAAIRGRGPHLSLGGPSRAGPEPPPESSARPEPRQRTSPETS